MSKRVAVVEFINESNTFTINRTDMSDFYASHYFQGDEIAVNFEGTGSEVGGFMEVAKDCDWTPIYTIAAHAEPGGKVTEQARKTITDDALRHLKANGPYDGLFIALHGAMVTESDQDGDGQFLRAVREVVGEEVPIAVTLDLHANIFDEMADLVDIVVSYRTYPHVDMREVGVEACWLLDRVMSGDVEPGVLIERPPMLVGCDDGRTTNDGPMCRLLEMAKDEMQQAGILNIAINAGFTDADVFAAGPSVIVNYDQNAISKAEARAVARRVCDQIWLYRDIWELPVSLKECIERLKARENGGGPVVVADFSDNPGSGAYSDCTAVLRALIDHDLQDAALGAILDPEAVKLLIEAGEGADVTLPIGGKTDPNVGGGPLEVTGIVQAISDGQFTFEGPMFTGLPGMTGPSVCFRIRDIDVMIVSERMQMLDQNIFRSVGIEPKDKSIVVVKSMQHFRGAFAAIADEIIVTDAGGLSSPNVSSRDYVNIRRPVFPLNTFEPA